MPLAPPKEPPALPKVPRVKWEENFIGDVHRSSYLHACGASLSSPQYHEVLHQQPQLHIHRSTSTSSTYNRHIQLPLSLRRDWECTLHQPCNTSQVLELIYYQWHGGGIGAAPLSGSSLRESQSLSWAVELRKYQSNIWNQDYYIRIEKDAGGFRWKSKEPVTKGG